MNYRPSLQQKLNESDYSDYTLHFQPVLNSNGSVLFIDHSQDKKLTIGINVDDTEFKYRLKAEFPAIVADLIDLAVAIYTSDRLAPQTFTQKQRRFHVILPVRHPELLSAEPFLTKLDDLLKWTLPPLTMSCDSPHRQKPVQCGYCSSCLLRRQSLAATNIKDRTRYVVLHGKSPVKDPSLCFLNMLAQVRTLDSLFAVSDEPWKTLTKKFPILDDVVDRTATAENLLPADMRSRLIQLYQNYVSEWNAVESQIVDGLLNKGSYQKASSKYVVSSQ